MKSVSGYRALSLSTAFSSAWYAFIHPDGNQDQKMDFTISAALFPGNLRNLKLNNVYIRLDATTIPATLTLNIPNQSPVKLLLSNNTAEYKKAGIKNFGGTWSLTAKAGSFDPQQVRNMVLILTYDGEVQWNP